MKGYELPKEAWSNAADNVSKVAPIIAKWLEKNSPRGAADAEDFLADMQLAHAALTYVAEFAKDKCRIIPVQD